MFTFSRGGIETDEAMISAFSGSLSDPFTARVVSFDGGGMRRAEKYSPPNENHLISPFSLVSKGSTVVFVLSHPGTQPEVPVPPNSFFSTFPLFRKAYFKP